MFAGYKPDGARRKSFGFLLNNERTDFNTKLVCYGIWLVTKQEAPR